MAEEDSVSLMDIEIEEEEMNRKEYIAERKLTTDDHVVEAEEFFDWCDACGCVECCCEELDEIQE